MGSCISKCRPKTPSLKDCNLVQDKLVISQASTSTTPIHVVPPPKKPAPQDSPSSSCATTFTTSSYTSSSTKSPPSSLSSPSFSSSSLISKDRSFSNEFLWSCARENPHLLSVDPVKSSVVVPVKRLIPAKSVTAPTKSRLLNQQPQTAGSTPQKRVRPISATLTRQKSFRKEPTERVIESTNLNSLSRRNMGSLSPMPSRRRRTGEACREITKSNQPKESCHPDQIGFKRKPMNAPSISERNKENLQPAGCLPKDIRHRDGSYLKRIETCAHHINPGIDRNAVGLAVSNQLEMNSLLTDDTDNPLISLDCFIFL